MSNCWNSTGSKNWYRKRRVRLRWCEEEKKEREKKYFPRVQSPIFKRKAAQNSKTKAEIFRGTPLQFHGAICLELTVRNGLVLSQFKTHLKTFLFDQPFLLESSTFSDNRWRVCWWLVECGRKLIDRIDAARRRARLEKGDEEKDRLKEWRRRGDWLALVPVCVCLLVHVCVCVCVWVVFVC